MMPRHFLNLSDAGGDIIAAMIDDALDRKAARAAWPKGQPDADAPLSGRVLAMIFEKNSTRTRVSFDMAMRQLGGTAMVMQSPDAQILRTRVADEVVWGLPADSVPDVIMSRTRSGSLSRRRLLATCERLLPIISPRSFCV